MADRPAGEDQAAALDIELARIRRVFSLLDIELARGGRGLIVTAAHGDVARQAAGQSRRVDIDMVFQAQRDGARHLKSLRRVGLLLPDDHFVRRGADGAGQVGGDDLGVGDL